MKINRKTVLSTAAVLGVAALIAGGTIAYFTDTESTDNNFTVGKVDIALYESQLHRMNSGRQGVFPALASDADYCDWNYERTAENGIDSNTTAGPQPFNPTTGKGGYESAKYCTPGMNANEGNASSISAIAKGHTGRTWGYTDATIIADAATYKNEDDPTTDVDESGYFERVSKNIVPGQYIRKFSYVKNDNTDDKGSDAYVLIRYMVPKEYADIVDFELPSSAYLEDKNVSATTNGKGYFTLVENNNGVYSKVAIDSQDKDENKNTLKAYRGHEEGQYVVYTAVTTEALKPGEMTFWSPVNTMQLSADEEQTESGSGIGDVSYTNAAFSVKVDAQAIQAKTFSDAIDAINHL